MPTLLIAFLTCASALCTRHDLPFDGSAMQCAMFGQAEVARWTCLSAGEKGV